MRKSKRTLANMTPDQKKVYYREYNKSRKAGINKWDSIKFARSIALYIPIKETISRTGLLKKGKSNTIYKQATRITPKRPRIST